MRNRYLVAYDVSDAVRLRRTHGKLKGFGDPLQYSVFTCDLSRKELAIMKAALSEIIDHHEDRVVIIDVGPVSGRGSLAMQTLGRQVAPVTREVLVVYLGLPAPCECSGNVDSTNDRSQSPMGILLMGGSITKPT